MTKATRTTRRQAAADTRVIACNLRAAARHEGITVRELRAIERRNYIPTGRLLLALAGISLKTSHMFVLQYELGLSVSQVFLGTGTRKVPA